MSALLIGLADIFSVAALIMPTVEVSVANQAAPRNAATFAPENNFEQSETVETRDLALTTDLEAPSTGLNKRATNSKFKIHVVNATARVLGIIMIDHTINLLPCSHESITANFDKLTNVRTNVRTNGPRYPL